MALAYLQILFIVLALISIIAQVLLYKDKSNNKISIFIFNAILGIIFSWLVYTSMPSNFYTQKIISLVWGVLAITGLTLKIFNIGNVRYSKILLTISVIGGMIHLFL